MAARPCNPNSDLKRLWRFLLPNEPFPHCPTPAAPDAGGSDGASPAEKPQAAAEPAPPGREA